MFEAAFTEGLDPNLLLEGGGHNPSGPLGEEEHGGRGGLGGCGCCCSGEYSSTPFEGGLGEDGGAGLEIGAGAGEMAAAGWTGTAGACCCCAAAPTAPAPPFRLCLLFLFFFLPGVAALAKAGEGCRTGGADVEGLDVAGGGLTEFLNLST